MLQLQQMPASGSVHVSWQMRCGCRWTVCQPAAKLCEIECVWASVILGPICEAVAPLCSCRMPALEQWAGDFVAPQFCTVSVLAAAVYSVLGGHDSLCLALGTGAFQQNPLKHGQRWTLTCCMMLCP